MRTHRAKSGYLPAEYIPPTFLTRTPSPYSAGWRWGGCYREKFFLILFFFVSPIRFLLVFYFFDFRLDSCFDSVFQVILFNYFDSIKIRHLILYFIFQTLRRFDSHTSFTQYLLVCNSRIRFWILLASISTCFSIVYSMLWLFNSLSL